VADREAREADAAVEGPAADCGDRVGDVGIGQSGAPVERVAADVQESRREHDARQTGAAVEGIICNRVHAGGNREWAFPGGGIIQEHGPVLIVQHAFHADVGGIVFGNVQGGQLWTTGKSPILN